MWGRSKQGEVGNCHGAVQGPDIESEEAPWPQRQDNIYGKPLDARATRGARDLSRLFMLMSSWKQCHPLPRYSCPPACFRHRP